MTARHLPQAILVLPHLRVQNANAISGPLTHGFPPMMAFTGAGQALERNLARHGIPLRLHGVGVICHDHQEQVAAGYVRTFNLTRNPVDKDGTPRAIVEEGRIHLEITLVFGITEKLPPGQPVRLLPDNAETLSEWASKAGELLAQMRVAGGSVLQCRRPWIAILPEDPQAAEKTFRDWRRRWLPGFALVGRDDLLNQRLEYLRAHGQPDATLFDAWLHAARWNNQPLSNPDGTFPKDGHVRWGDPLRPRGSGWIVPIPVGYRALHPEAHPPGAVRNARDATIPAWFVETAYSLGQWISPHRLNGLNELLWHPETDESLGLFRCCNGYCPSGADSSSDIEEDEDDSYDAS